MTSIGCEAARPAFIDGARGRLFSLTYPPAADVDRGHCYVCVTPLAEEANRCRRMVALQARAFQRLGYRVVIVDPYGTGDSDGDFGDADWSVWLDDLAAVCAAAGAASGVSLWAIRGGALLAGDLVGRSDALSLRDVLLWQPVLDGRVFVTQLLRLRTIAGVIGGGSANESVSDLKAMLAQGQCIEVAGYLLNPQLVDAMQHCRLEAASMPMPVLWFEKRLGETDAPSPASVRVADAWRERGTSVDVSLFDGEAFWSTTEITVAPELIDATCHRAAGSRA